jgi:unsaturated rhamnogalacturonyl hydrolase
MGRFQTAVASLLAIAVCTGIQACAATPHAEAVAGTPADAGVLAKASRVADWQLSHMERFDYVRTFQRQTADETDWIQAAFYAGLVRFADATNAARYEKAVVDHGRKNGWGYGDRPRHADDDAIGQAWVWAAAKVDGAERTARLAPTRARFDAVLAAPSDVPLLFEDAPGDQPCQARWCWSDALFMAPPVWFELSRLTGDPRYAAHADKEFWAATDLLYDRQARLYYRDSRFLDRRDAEGRKIFWSRGNGWTYAGVAKVIGSLPESDPRRARYVSLYREMSAAIVSLQRPDGYWPVSLLDPSGPPETSGTGFFVYGLAWGVNNGLLDDARFGRAVSRGWAALEKAVSADGKLGWVQQVGYAPDQVRAEDTQLYGVGAYLMAASEVAVATGTTI